ncbi:MAG: hypothetical protein CML68_21265 [Rhodobacteraceae bacterium]|nr:hypothetical protein [Paracoccaceae bacterium]
MPLAAQTAVGNPAQALAEARQRLVCGTGTVVDATYLTGGLLQATCRAQQSPRTLPSELQGTALTAGQAAAAAAAALLLVVVATGGGDDNSSTTTTYKYSD